MALVILADPEAVAAAGAERFEQAARDAVAAHGRFDVALAGGSTPQRMFALLAADGGRHRARVDWTRVQFFWGDERHVPPEHADSNYGAARRRLLVLLGLQPEQVHRIHGELADAEQAAADYEGVLRAHLPAGDDGVPRLDLVLLGMGDDGHTASLFPGSAALGRRDRLVVAHHVERLGAWRITMTPPLLNAARRVVFLVTGAAKAPALRAVLEGEPDVDRYPAQAIAPHDGALEWIVDTEAAALLARRD